MFNSIYKKKYEKLKKDFDNKVKKQANELYKERQASWIIKEQQYKQELCLKKLQIREQRIEIERLNKLING